VKTLATLALLLLACGSSNESTTSPDPDPFCAGKHFLFAWSNGVDLATGQPCTLPELPSGMTVSTDGTSAQTDIGECTGIGVRDECIFNCPGGLTLDFGTPDSGIIGGGAFIGAPGCDGSMPTQPCCHEAVTVSEGAL
jgi:hypothetical protein